MPKWQSKAQREEQEYQELFRREYPALVAKMQAYVDAYDEHAPVEEQMKTLKDSPVALLKSRMAKYCVWPVVRQIAVSVSFQSRLVSQSIDTFTKPMQDVYLAEKRAEKKAQQEAFKLSAVSRTVVDEGLYRRGGEPGEITIVGERVLTCLSCEYIRADEDMGQFESGYQCRFAEPTPEEKETQAYLQAKQQLETKLERENMEKERFEQRRKRDVSS